MGTLVHLLRGRYNIIIQKLIWLDKHTTTT